MPVWLVTKVLLWGWGQSIRTHTDTHNQAQTHPHSHVLCPWPGTSFGKVAIWLHNK